MRIKSIVLFAALALLVVPRHVSAKGDTVRIIIDGGNLPEPLELTDPNVVGGFNLWTGPGTSPHSPQGFIVDWSRGVAKPPQDVPVYRVSFVTNRPADHRTYVVSYVIDPVSHEGYVYLPGKSDAGYADNVWLIHRGVEGNWFHAWQDWEKVAHPLLAKAKSRP